MDGKLFLFGFGEVTLQKKRGVIKRLTGVLHIGSLKKNQF